MCLCHAEPQCLLGASLATVAGGWEGCKCGLLLRAELSWLTLLGGGISCLWRKGGAVFHGLSVWGAEL